MRARTTQLLGAGKVAEHANIAELNGTPLRVAAFEGQNFWA